uniref:Uncharacterized protein n=1 Tax=Arundo donax TaxID=35708 RepID=A0A0A9F820_ARUDO
MLGYIIVLIVHQISPVKLKCSNVASVGIAVLHFNLLHCQNLSCGFTLVS